MFDIGLAVQAACIWEVTARKPGNVHRFSDFEDAHYLDFLLSAAAVAPVLSAAGQKRVGPTILEAMRATRQVTRSNTNLGMVLLLAPLAAVPANENLREGLIHVLAELDLEDARSAYEAIRLANPGGLGRAAQQDVNCEPTLGLREVMALAADRDSIARQYANGFQDVFQTGLGALERSLSTASLERAIIGCHLHLMAALPDSLILRKRGPAEAEESRRRAQSVLDVGWPKQPAGTIAFRALDAWLRAEGHQRNPGTTADLVTACLFAALRTGLLTMPPSLPW